MGKRSAAILSGEWVHLMLRGRTSAVLVRDEKDWRALELIARRMLFWYGGAIHGCRCEGNEMRFAIQVSHTSIGSIARHLSGGYAGHLRRRSGVVGGVFKHYIAFAVDGESFIDDFVIWLHRPASRNPDVVADTGVCWTGEFAYLSPAPSSWITTERVLKALGGTGIPGRSYLRRKMQETDPEILARFIRPPRNRGRAPLEHESPRRVPQVLPNAKVNIERIVQVIAPYCGVSIDDMRSDSRRRVVTKANIVAAVLATRNGASVAAVARFLGRSRSTLVEQAEYYRERFPPLFEAAERHLEESLGQKKGGVAEAKNPRVPLTPIAAVIERSSRRRPR